MECGWNENNDVSSIERYFVLTIQKEKENKVWTTRRKKDL